MPRGTHLSIEERTRIKSLRECGTTIREIARRMQRNKKTIFSFLKNPDSYGTSKRTGRKPLVCERTKRQIKRLAIDTHISPSKIKLQLSLPVSTRRIQQILKNDENLKYVKRVPQPRLQKRHKNARLLFAEKHKFWEDEWRSVVFSDEKKFNLDGPDGQQKYWADIRRERESRFRRNFQGGSLMIWAAFGYNGPTPICFINHKMNADLYIELLDSVLIDYSENFCDDPWIFQQDNAAIHNAKATKRFFSDRNINVMEWPAISPDVNPIENIWAILSQRVYANGRQFETVKDLRTCIEHEWKNIPLTTFRSLIESMPRRINAIIISKGGTINY